MSWDDDGEERPPGLLEALRTSRQSPGSFDQTLEIFRTTLSIVGFVCIAITALVMREFRVLLTLAVLAGVDICGYMLEQSQFWSELKEFNRLICRRNDTRSGG